MVRDDSCERPKKMKAGGRQTGTDGQRPAGLLSDELLIKASMKWPVSHLSLISCLSVSQLVCSK